MASGLWDAVHRDLARRRLQVPLDLLKEKATHQAPALDPRPALAGGEVSVIAELGPPSVELACAERTAVLTALAGQFEAGGAHCLSVWSDAPVHGASVADLEVVRSAVEVPILAKDYIVSGYQLWEARAAGADMVLLMAAHLEAEVLLSLVERTFSLGMTPVVQVRDEPDLDSSLASGARLLALCHQPTSPLTQHGQGIPEGCRRLAALAARVPDAYLRIADVGARDPHELLMYAQAGADAVVVGSVLRSAKRPEAAVQELVTAGSHPAVRHARQCW